MLPQLLVFATLALMCFLAVIAIFYAHNQSSTERFSTSGHKSSEFKAVALVILILLVGKWTGMYAVLGLQNFPEATATDYVELTKALAGYGSTAAWCITVVTSVYVTNRTYLKVHAKK